MPCIFSMKTIEFKFCHKYHETTITGLAASRRSETKGGSPAGHEESMWDTGNKKQDRLS